MGQKIKGHLAGSLIVNDDFHDEACAAAIAHREEEIHGYLLNIENYEAMQLDPECPPDLKDMMAERLVSENREMEKSKAVYRALLSQLPAGQKREKAIAAEKSKRAARKV